MIAQTGWAMTQSTFYNFTNHSKFTNQCYSYDLCFSKFRMARGGFNNRWGRKRWYGRKSNYRSRWNNRSGGSFNNYRKRNWNPRNSFSRKGKRKQHYYTTVIQGQKVRCPKLGYVQLVSKANSQVERYITENQFFNQSEQLSLAFVCCEFNALLYQDYLNFFVQQRANRGRWGPPAVAQGTVNYTPATGANAIPLGAQ